MSPSDKVTYGETVYGHAAYIDRRTAAHLDYTKNALKGQHPGCTLLLIQGGYNTSVAASQGTHDFGATVDLKVNGLSWDVTQRFLRSNGWAAWHRTQAQGFSMEHVHAISLGYTCKVGEYVDGGISLTGRRYTSSQVADYYAHSLGLKGQHSPGADHSWFPPNINATVFDYAEWIKEQDMPSPKDWDAADWAAIGKNLPKLLWNFKPDNVGVTMRGLLVGLAQKSGVI